MPFLDFTEAKDLPEGITPELLANESVQNFIKSGFENTFQKRFETEASGLQANIDAIKAEKVKLQGYLDGYKGVDMDEYAQLQEFKKNNGDASSQIATLTAEKDAIKEAYETKLADEQTQRQTIEQSLHAEQLTNKASQGIREHNSQFPTVAVKEGAERWVIEEAGKVFKRDDKGNYIPMNGDRVLTGDSGDVMTYGEWVNSLRKRAEFAPLFEVPSGGGAGGSGNPAGKGHFNPKDLAGSKEERQAAIAAKFNLPG